MHRSPKSDVKQERYKLGRLPVITLYDYGWEEWKGKILQAFPDHRDFATFLRTMLAKKR
jgi:hypothetical protein